MPVLFLPSLALGVYWHKYLATDIDLDVLVRMFAAGFLGSLIVMVVELVLVIIFALICFYNQVIEWNSEDIANGNWDNIVIKRNAGFWIFLVLMAFVVAGCTEESLK